MNSSLTGHQPTSLALGEEVWDSLGSLLDDPLLSRSCRIPCGALCRFSPSRCCQRCLQCLNPHPGLIPQQEQLGRDSFLFILQHLSCLAQSRAQLPLIWGICCHLSSIPLFPALSSKAKRTQRPKLIPGFDPGCQGEEFRV